MHVYTPFDTFFNDQIFEGSTISILMCACRVSSCFPAVSFPGGQTGSEHRPLKNMQVLFQKIYPTVSTHVVDGGWIAAAQHSWPEYGSQNIIERVAEVAAVLGRVPFFCNSDLRVCRKIALLLKMPVVVILKLFWHCVFQCINLFKVPYKVMSHLLCNLKLSLNK